MRRCKSPISGRALRRRAWAWIAVAVAAAVLTTLVGVGSAATSTTVVGATVPSATSLVTTGCAARVAGRTDFGSVLPGTSVVTTSDCAIAFGSSNDTSQLRVRQSDSVGSAMWSPSRGVLDTSFDGDGRATAPIAPAAGTDYANEVLVQPDGRIVSVGHCELGGGTGADFCVTRSTGTGGLDPSFDGDGRVTVAIGPATASDIGHGAALQPDGKLIVVGYCATAGPSGSDACLIRLDSNGALDPTFDTDGRVITTIAPGAGEDVLWSVTVGSDGKILVAGHCDMGVTGLDACLARYNPDGSLDTTFDIDGRVTTTVGPGAGNDYLEAVAVQPNGRIVVVGQCAMGGASGDDGCVVRYNVDGSLDTSFDGDGRVSTATGPGIARDYFRAVAIQDDDRIVAAGMCDMGAGSGDDACLARYNVNGGLDTSFDTDGRATTAIGPGVGNDRPRAMAMQGDGRIVIAGQCNMGATTGLDACVVRYNPDGSLDTAFDGDGRVTTATGAGSALDYARGLTLGVDGQILTTGYCDMGATGLDFCLAAYSKAGVISQYADDGVSDWDTAGSSPNLFGACLRSVTGGATAQWPTTGSCTATDGPVWNALPASSTKVAYNTALEPDPADATANFRFGMRASGGQVPGSYVAPISFEVLAPNA